MALVRNFSLPDLDGGDELSNAQLTGRMVVLEVTLMTCLGLLLDTESNEGAVKSLAILASISRTVTARCSELDLSSEVLSAAETYVSFLMQIAKMSLLQ